MDIDIYQQCPCHTEKKIKFCCGKGIVNDLNQILAKNSSGQAVAALDQIDRIIQKDGPKDCLRTIQTHILLTAGEIEKAKIANAEFLKDNPKHSTGLHHKSIIAMAEGRTLDAVEALQDAMDAITGNEIPISLGNAFRVIGIGLLQQSNHFAGLAHLRYAISLKGDSDPELQHMVMDVMRNPNLPMLLKQDLALRSPVEGVEWEKRYRNVHRALDRGQFRKALSFLERIDQEHPDLPIVVRGLATVNAYLGRIEPMVEAWRRYSSLDGVSNAEAIEAEAIAQVFDAKNLPNQIPIVRTTYELKEVEPVSESAISNRRLVSTPNVPGDPFQEGPAPRSLFAVIDREPLESADGVTLDNIPVVAGELLLYGKQTDRAARLESVSTRDHRGEVVSELIQTCFKEFISGQPKEQEIGEADSLAEVFDANWHLPKDTSKAQHTKLLADHREQVILNKWPNTSLAGLEGKTPVEAAAEKRFELPLQAMLVMLGNAAQGQYHHDGLIQKLREKLGLPEIEEVEYPEQGHVSSPIVQQQLDPTKLSDQALLRVRDQAMQVGNLRVLRPVVNEILNRESIDIPKDISYSMLAQMSIDDDDAFKYISKAREAAEATPGRSVGLVLVREFDIRLQRGATEKLAELLQEIQQNHLGEPDVEFQLVRVLDRYGIGPEQGPLRGGQPKPQVPVDPGAGQPAGDGSPIWTPDQAGAQPAPEPGSEEPKSKLWIPD